MDVIRQAAVAEDAHAVLACLEPQGGEVQDPIGVGAENGLAVVAALGDVMRYAAATTLDWCDMVSGYETIL